MTKDHPRLALAAAPAYDFFGVQRPGRAFFLKVTAER
jgi:hypothetical protein